jgi:Leucine-rich repeat (LRR) protein
MRRRIGSPALNLIVQNRDAFERGEDASVLDLGNCGLTEIPVEIIQNADWIKKLILGDSWNEYNEESQEMELRESKNKGEINTLTNIDNIAQLKNLEHLVISNYRTFTRNDESFELVILPLQNLTNLKSLSIENIDIKENDFSPIAKLSQLEKLTCSSTNLDSIDNLTELWNLKSINFSDTKIESLESISQCTNLEYLDCSFSAVSSLLPLVNILSLKKIKCRGANLQEIDSLRGYIERLTYLNVSLNNLSYPNEIVELENCVHDLTRFWKENISPQFKREKINIAYFDHNSSINGSTILSIFNQENLISDSINYSTQIGSKEICIWDISQMGPIHNLIKILFLFCDIYVFIWQGDSYKSSLDQKKYLRACLDILASSKMSKSVRVIIIEKMTENFEINFLSNAEKEEFAQRRLEITSHSFGLINGKRKKSIASIIEEELEAISSALNISAPPSDSLNFDDVPFKTEHRIWDNKLLFMVITRILQDDLLKDQGLVSYKYLQSQLINVQESTAISNDQLLFVINLLNFYNLIYLIKNTDDSIKSVLAPELKELISKEKLEDITKPKLRLDFKFHSGMYDRFDNAREIFFNSKLITSQEYWKNALLGYINSESYLLIQEESQITFYSPSQPNYIDHIKVWPGLNFLDKSHSCVVYFKNKPEKINREYDSPEEFFNRIKTRISQVTEETYLDDLLKKLDYYFTENDNDNLFELIERIIKSSEQESLIEIYYIKKAQYNELFKDKITGNITNTEFLERMGQLRSQISGFIGEIKKSIDNNTKYIHSA